MNRILIVPAQAILYKIIIGTKYYVGSTKGSLQARLLVHYKKSTLFPNRKVYKAIADLGGWSLCTIEIIKMFAFTTAEALRLEEKAFINLADECCLNSIRSSV
jgi:hypothetical protein